MATSLQSLRMSARCCTYRITIPKYPSNPIAHQKLFSSTSKQYKTDPKFLQLEKDAPDAGLFNAEIDRMIKKAGDEQAAELPKHVSVEGVDRKWKDLFLNMGESRPFDEKDRSDNDDDISTFGHLELEQVREMRHYARLAAWEMPLLSKFAKPFNPPSATTPLRFRYTTYMGEQHPAEKKVVLEFCPEDMPGLTEEQTDKLRKLVGPRLNPETDIIRMSCEMYPSQAQNKRYLSDLVDTLLEEAQTGDTFEDVPLDTRHHVFKLKTPKFPEEWILTEDRKLELENHRRMLLQRDLRREYIGGMVDGQKIIGDALANTAVHVPEAVEVGRKVTIKK